MKVWILLLALLLILPTAALAEPSPLMPMPGQIVQLKSGDTIRLGWETEPAVVTFSFTRDEYDTATGYTLGVGEQSVTGEGFNLTEEVWALKTVGMGDTLLLVSEYGPSDDDACYVYLYDGETLHDIGIIGTLPQNITLSPGLITGFVRGLILQTWYRPADFVVSHNYSYNEQTGETIDTPRIVEVPRAVYPMGTQVTLKVDLDALIQPQQGAPVALKLKAGEQVVLAASDDVAWVYIEALAGREDGPHAGWFFVGLNTYDSVPLGKKMLPSTEVFDGLWFAD